MLEREGGREGGRSRSRGKLVHMLLMSIPGMWTSVDATAAGGHLVPSDTPHGRPLAMAGHAPWQATPHGRPHPMAGHAPWQTTPHGRLGRAAVCVYWVSRRLCVVFREVVWMYAKQMPVPMAAPRAEGCRQACVRCQLT